MKLIVNADDFGLTNGVNEGIRDCFLVGSVSSTTLMVNMEATAEAVEIARVHPGLGTGLHFNLTLGRPLSETGTVPSLVDNEGNFYLRREFEKRIMLGRIDQAEITREFKAQVGKFKSFGIPLTHLDSHQHAHLFPVVFDVLAGYCETENIPLRVPWVWSQSGKVSLKRRTRSMLLSFLIRRNLSGWEGRIPYNNGFASIFDLSLPPGRITLSSYLDIISNIQESPFELMVHPAKVDESLKGLTEITETSEAEHRILSRNNIKDIARSYGLEMVSYREAMA